MNVSDLLTLMGTLSVGNDNVMPTERAIFLQYLNLAHLELYQATANLNPDLMIQEHVAAPQGTATLSQTPYGVSAVYEGTSQTPLTRFSSPQATTITGGKPFGYRLQHATLCFVPAQTSPVSATVWYVPQPPTLTEDTQEEGIPYPVAYHPVLADGALYYLFQGEGGFKSASQNLEAKNRWEIGKSKLAAYLLNASGQHISTFSNA